MYRASRLIHVLGFALLFGGIIAAGVSETPLVRVLPVLGLGFGALLLSGLGMLAASRGRVLRQGWLRVHLLLALAVVPAMINLNLRGDGAALLIVAIVLVAAMAVAAIKPRLSRST